MAERADDFAFLISSARRSIERLATHPRLLADQPAGRGQALTDHIRHTIYALQQRMEFNEQRFIAAKDDSDRQVLLSQIRRLHGFVRSMHRAIPWLDTLGRETISLGIRYFVDEAANVVVQRSTDAVITASTEYSTETRPFDIVVDELEKMSAPGEPVPPPVSALPIPVVLNYPGREMASVLLHADFVHELGHTAAAEHQWVDRINDPLLDTASAALTVAAQGLAHYSRLTQSAAEAVLRGRLKHWITELLCDSVAVQYLGPTYLFSSAAVVLATNWDEPGERHPPTTERLLLMLGQLESMGWLSELERTAPNIVAWLQSVAVATRPSAGPGLAFLLDRLGAAREPITKLICGHVGDQSFLPAAFAPTAGELARYLERKILPAQLWDEPVPRRAILLAGWMYLIAEHGDHPRTLSNALDNDELQVFLGKAMEMSSVLESWRAL